jgi:tetratricopeptide (TPR) repeat protein
MRIKILILLFALLYANHVSSQISLKNKKFKDHKTKLYGIKIKNSNEIIVPPKYKMIQEFNDSIIIIKENKLYSAIDYKGNALSCTTQFFIFIETADPKHLGKIRLQDTNDEILIPPYFVSKDCGCIPENYYPCPSIQSIKSEIPDDLRIIQNAIDEKTKGQYEKAIELAENAIKLQPSNPANYYWYTDFVCSSLYNSTSNPIVYNNFKKRYVNQAELYITKAIELEKDTFSLVNIYNCKYELERKYTKNKKEEKLVYKKFKSFNARMFQIGFMFQINSSIQNSDYSSGLCFGLGANHRRMKDIKYESFFVGFGFERFWQSKTNSYKMSFSYLFPIYITTGLDLGKLTNINNTGNFINPSVGFHIHGFQLNYGYKFISNNEFSNQKGHNFALKYEFLISSLKYFTKD